MKAISNFIITPYKRKLDNLFIYLFFNPGTLDGQALLFDEGSSLEGKELKTSLSMTKAKHFTPLSVSHLFTLLIVTDFSFPSSSTTCPSFVFLARSLAGDFAFVC